ncbi:FtsB family cell division protein [Aureimonas glaciei]|jgi:cell division protein FtsB|uniref:Cell division protein n=1 Tax=Aureimonas glaciei TaxID=1776957 RepID=A0A917DC11_9HYPH|nr:septum formation initiator family protein [Aureimonas glaciei]GGD25138.1 cell division protein [Aureimonas glaciei]
MGRLIVPAITLSFLAYFAFHAQSGKYGIGSKEILASDLAGAQTRYEQLLNRREKLERRVQLLHDGTLERDMIDESARRLLGYSATDEVTIMR